MSGDRKSTRLNSSHLVISYAVFCLKKKKKQKKTNKRSRLVRLSARCMVSHSARDNHDSTRGYHCHSSPHLFLSFFFFFFFNDTATTEIYTLSLHDALPI